MPKISIIIPVYNVEKYLNQCLDSILNQTFTDWECILIDDGSVDNSGKICDEYGEKDNRFIVIHQKNAGVSVARNAGLQIARGEWIGFVDSDDYIDSNTFEDVLKKIQGTNVDLVQWGIVLEVDGEVLLRKFPKQGILNEKDLFEYFEPSTCHKLFKKSIITANKIMFPEGLTLSEDRYFSFVYYLHCNNVLGIDDCYYHYRIYSESSTHNMTEKNISDEVLVIEKMEQSLLKIENRNIQTYKQILINQKIEAKNHSIFLLNRPNCKLWRKLYPEVYPEMIRCKGIKKFLYFMLKFHFDFFVISIIYVKKSMRKF